MTTTSPELQQIVDAIRARQRFVLSSHSRPDGDSIGSQLAMAYALRALGKEVDRRQRRPGAAAADGVSRRADIADRRRGRRRVRRRDHHGVRRPGAHRRRAGSIAFFVINIDHHPGNTGYGQINWFDATRRGLRRDGVRPGARARRAAVASRSRRTSTSRSSPTPARSTTRASRRARSTSAASALEAGVDPVLVARNVYDSNNMGRLKLFGAVLSAMQIDPTGRIAIVYLDHEMARAAGGTYEDTEGLINLPLTVKEIQAVVFFKQIEGDEYRVSMRSKGDIDIGAVAKEFGGGGHKNAAGCTRIDARSCRSTRARRTDCSVGGNDSSDAGTDRMDGLLVVDKPSGPTSHDVVARVRRALRRAAHRPHRHARSAGDRRPAAGRRTGHAARALPERERQVVRRRRPPRLRDRHRRRPGEPPGRRTGAAAVARRDRRGARRVSRHVPAAAAGVLGEEDRRRAQLRAARGARTTGAADATARRCPCRRCRPGRASRPRSTS